MEIRHADLQIEVEDAEDGGVLLTIIDSARLSRRGPFPESRISAPFRWAAPRLARQRRPAVAGRSLSTRANGRRST